MSDEPLFANHWRAVSVTPRDGSWVRLDDRGTRTRVPHPQENAPPQDLTAEQSLGPYGGPRGGGVLI
jgi:hypothetical protein